MNEIITTLHPENDENINLYPNIKLENIPLYSIDKSRLNNELLNLLNNIGSLHPSGVDTSTNILAFTEDKGIYVGSDDGNWYFWNGTQYVVGDVYQALILGDNSITYPKLDSNIKKIFNVTNITLSKTSGQYYNYTTGAISTVSTMSTALLDVNEGDLYLYTATNTGLSKACAVMFFDSNDNMLSYLESGYYNLTDYYFVVPSGAVKMGLSGRTANDMYLKKITMSLVSRNGNQLLDENKNNLYPIIDINSIIDLLITGSKLSNATITFNKLSDDILIYFGINNIFDYNNVIMGTLDSNGEWVDSDVRACSNNFIEVNPKETIKLLNRNGFYASKIFEYSSNQAYIGQKDLTYVGNDSTVVLRKNTKYIKFIYRKSVGTITSNDFPNMKILIYKSIETTNEITKIKLCTFNVGKFAYGNPQSEEYDAILETKLQNWKNILSQVLNPDIMCINEYIGYANSSHTIDTNNTFLNDIFKYVNDCYSGAHKNWAGIGFASKYNIISFTPYNSTAGLEGTGYNRKYLNIKIDIKGKILDIWCIHYIPNGTAQSYGLDGEEVRIAETNEILEKIADSEYAIVMGDFNAIPTSPEMQLYITNGYKMLNGGYNGTMDTRYIANTPIDNIILSPNIVLNYAKVIDTYDELTSDHLPLIAEITLS